MANHPGAPPEIIEKHTEAVIAAVEELRTAETALEAARTALRVSIQAAFKEKVKVGALMKATGLSETRVYQLRDAEI